MNKNRLAIAIAISLPFAANTGYAATGIEIIKAVYGDEAGGKICDATTFISKICSAKERCYFKADDHICGDPTPNNPKTLRVTYKCAYRGPYDAIFDANDKKEEFLACY